MSVNQTIGASSHQPFEVCNLKFMPSWAPDAPFPPLKHSTESLACSGTDMYASMLPQGNTAKVKGWLSALL